jgi:hypothetical protein
MGFFESFRRSVFSGFSDNDSDNGSDSDRQMRYFDTEYDANGTTRTAYGKNNRHNIQIGDEVLLGSSGGRIRARVTAELNFIPHGENVNWIYPVKARA